MNAKDAVLAELGDLFAYFNTPVAQDANEEEAGVLIESESTEDSDASDPFADIEGDRPPSLFDIVSEEEEVRQDNEGVSIEERLKSLSDEECEACIKAIDAAISSTKMPPSQVEWGLDIIGKISQIQNDRILEQLNSIDAAAEQERIAQEEAEEEERENADKEAYLRR